MSEAEVLKVFECLGLVTQEKRDKVLFQGKVTDFNEKDGIKLKTWVSNKTSFEYEEGNISAKLEGSP